MNRRGEFMSKVKIQLPDGRIIERVAKTSSVGNFCQQFVTLDNELYSLGDGDEYIRGTPDVWKLSYSYNDKKYVAYTEKEQELFSLSKIWKDFSNVR